MVINQVGGAANDVVAGGSVLMLGSERDLARHSRERA